MKKKTSQATRREPSATSLHEVPPVDFSGYRRGRRNPFAARVKAKGWSLAHAGPSAGSLRDVPELGPAARGRANPYAKRVAAEGYTLQVGRGRPTAGSEVGPTIVKSVRLPPAVWSRLEKKAKARGVALHALIRAALVAVLEEPPGKRRAG